MLASSPPKVRDAGPSGRPWSNAAAPSSAKRQGATAGLTAEALKMEITKAGSNECVRGG